MPTHKRVDYLLKTAEERTERSETTVRQSDRVGAESREQMEHTADAIETALEETKGQHDPSIARRVSDLIDYLRSSNAPVPNPVIELLREPEDKPRVARRPRP